MATQQGVYAACKAKVQAIQEAYDALVAAVEDYQGLLATLIEASDPEGESEKHLLVVARLQQNTTKGLMGTLESDLHDDLIRLSDRVIRFKHWEDGVFV